MYKVFLVEDEILVRENMIENDVWKNNNFILAGQASDGELALPLIEQIKPDILITDIKMPFMDGLELSRIVKKNMPHIKIIILSGYDEFSYAKEAMNIGITEYIVKPLSSEDLLEALNGVSKQIEKERRERKEYENASQSIQESLKIKKERFLNDLCTGMIPTGEAIDKAKSLDIHIFSKFYNVVLLIIDTKGNTASEDYTDYAKTEEEIDRILINESDILKFSKNIKQIVLILKGNNEYELENKGLMLAKSIKSVVEDQTKCYLTISIGGVYERIQGIADSYAETEMNWNYNQIFNKYQIIESHSRQKYGESWTIGLDEDKLLDFLRNGNVSDIPELINNCVEKIMSNRMSLMFCAYNIIHLNKTVNKFIKEIGADVHAEVPATDHLEQILKSIRSVEEFSAYMEKILKTALHTRGEIKSAKYFELITKAKQYIQDNYANTKSNLTLQSVANFVHISPAYFSTIFSQETGETFTEYITNTRIKKAIELLTTTNLRVSEIAFEVGYKEPHYFSQTFKKVTGKSPNSYRK